jgi:hypothetical protein
MALTVHVDRHHPGADPWVNPDPYNPIVRFVSATGRCSAHPAAGADVQNRDRPVAADRDPGDLFPEFFLVGRHRPVRTGFGEEASALGAEA